jgi:predicted dienelactone hydrolase
MNPRTKKYLHGALAAVAALAIAAFPARGIFAQPLDAGFELTDFKDPLGDGPMKVAIFYLTTSLHGNSIVGDWTIDAARDAPLAQGQYPLIAMSHGYGGNRISLFDFATYLARHDFIVITVTHPGDDFHNFAQWRSDRVLVGREYNIRAALDTIIADPVFGPHIDTERIGVAGSRWAGTPHCFFSALCQTLRGSFPIVVSSLMRRAKQIKTRQKSDLDSFSLRILVSNRHL